MGPLALPSSADPLGAVRHVISVPPHPNERVLPQGPAPRPGGLLLGIGSPNSDRVSFDFQNDLGIGLQPELLADLARNRDLALRRDSHGTSSIWTILSFNAPPRPHSRRRPGRAARASAVQQGAAPDRFQGDASGTRSE